MKKTTGILLTLVLSSQFALATCKIDGSRIDITMKMKQNETLSYKFSSINKVSILKSNQGTYIYRMYTDKLAHEIDKDTYEKIMDYMKNSK